MRVFSASDIFIKMNAGNGIISQLQNAVKSIDNKCILNNRLDDALDLMNKGYKDSLTTKVIEAVKKYRIIVVSLPIDKRFPAHIPYLRMKRNGKDCVVVDVSKYAVTDRADDGTISAVKIDMTKLYALLVPSYMALEVLNEYTTISSETIKWMALLWAKMFNKILMSQKIFVGSPERYEAFMYFAMRFFMIYYVGAPLPVVDNISGEFIKNSKSRYILTIENNLRHKNIDLYKDWNTFSGTMFSNEITNIRAVTNVDMNVDQYLRLFSSYMGRDGAYLALWSVDYFFYCIFVTWNHTWILSDRAWQTVVDDDPKILPRILRSCMREI